MFFPPSLILAMSKLTDTINTNFQLIAVNAVKNSANFTQAATNAQSATEKDQLNKQALAESLLAENQRNQQAGYVTNILNGLTSFGQQALQIRIV